MTHSLIPSSALDVLLKDPAEWSRVLRYGLEQFEHARSRGEPHLRLAGFEDDAVWFSEAKSSLEILDILWESVTGAHRNALEIALQYAINELPGWKPEQAAGLEATVQLRYVVPVFIAFVRRHERVRLVRALRAKSFGAAGWVKSPHLRSELLLTVFRLDYSLEVNDFVANFVDEDGLLLQLDHYQLRMLALAYVASLSAVVTESRDHVDAICHRLTELLYAMTESQNAPTVKDLNGRNEFILEGFNEALGGLALEERAIRESVKLLLPQIRPESTDERWHETLSIYDGLSQKIKSTTAAGQSAAPKSNSRPTRNERQT